LDHRFEVTGRPAREVSQAVQIGVMDKGKIAPVVGGKAVGPPCDGQVVFRINCGSTRQPCSLACRGSGGIKPSKSRWRQKRAPSSLSRPSKRRAIAHGQSNFRSQATLLQRAAFRSAGRGPISATSYRSIDHAVQGVFGYRPPRWRSVVAASGKNYFMASSKMGGVRKRWRLSQTSLACLPGSRFHGSVRGYTQPIGPPEVPYRRTPVASRCKVNPLRHVRCPRLRIPPKSTSHVDQQLWPSVPRDHLGRKPRPALGATVDGCPRCDITEEMYPAVMDKRQTRSRNKIHHAAAQADEVRILSGVFEGVTKPARRSS